MADIERSIEYVVKATDQASKTFKSIGVQATVMGGVITAAMATFVNSARDAVREEKQLDAVLKSTKNAAGLTKDELLKMAAGLQKVTNYSDDAIIAGENVLLTYTDIGRDVFPRAQEATLDMATALGISLTSASERVGNALQYPSLALNSLTKQGFRFTEEQKSMIVAMEAAGDIAGAQAIILGELEMAYQGRARATADPWIQLQNALGDVGEEIGKSVLPALNDLLTAITPIIYSITEWMQANPELVKQIATFVGILGVALLAVGSITTAIAAATVVMGTLGLTLGAGSPVILAIIAFAALATFVMQNWQQFADFFTILWDNVKAMLQTGVEFLVALFTGDFAKLGLIITQWVQNSLVMFKFLWDNLKGMFPEAIGAITGLWNGFTNALYTGITSTVGSIKEAFVDLFSWISDTISAIINKIGQLVQAAKDAVGIGSSSKRRNTGGATGRFAGGGVISEPVIVGEHGREAVSLPVGSRVVSASETRNALGKGGVNITLNVQGSLIGLSERNIVEMLGQEVMRSLLPNLSHA